MSVVSIILKTKSGDFTLFWEEHPVRLNRIIPRRFRRRLERIGKKRKDLFMRETSGYKL